MACGQAHGSHCGCEGASGMRKLTRPSELRNPFTMVCFPLAEASSRTGYRRSALPFPPVILCPLLLPLGVHSVRGGGSGAGARNRCLPQEVSAMVSLKLRNALPKGAKGVV